MLHDWIVKCTCTYQMRTPVSYCGILLGPKPVCWALEINGVFLYAVNTTD